MPNLYLSAKGYAKTFFVRRELKAVGKGYLYWLGHRTQDGNSSERVQVSREFYDDFRREIRRLKERRKSHKETVQKNHCGVAPVCTADGSHCFCNCTNCR